MVGLEKLNVGVRLFWAAIAVNFISGIAFSRVLKNPSFNSFGVLGL
jgi:hypothetical protein